MAFHQIPGAAVAHAGEVIGRSRRCGRRAVARHALIAPEVQEVHVQVLVRRTAWRRLARARTRACRAPCAPDWLLLGVHGEPPLEAKPPEGKRHRQCAGSQDVQPADSVSNVFIGPSGAQIAGSLGKTQSPRILGVAPKNKNAQQKRRSSVSIDFAQGEFTNTWLGCPISDPPQNFTCELRWKPNHPTPKNPRNSKGSGPLGTDTVSES